MGKGLEEKLPKPRRGEIIRNIKIEGQEEGTENYLYFPEKYPRWAGIIFPNDNVPELGRLYDVYVNKVVEKINKKVILSEIYFDLKRISEEILSVTISEMSNRNQPMFKLRGYRGFVVEGKANVGDEVRVKTLKVKTGNQKEMFLETKIVGG